MKKIFLSTLSVIIALGSFAQASIVNGTYYILSSANGLALDGSVHGSQVVTASSAKAVLYTITNTGDGNNSVYIRNWATGQNLDVSGAATGNTSPIISWDVSTASNQKWQFFVNGSNYEIRGVASGRNLSINGAYTTVGNGIILWDKNSNDWSQIWTLSYMLPKNITNGTYNLLNFGSGYALALGGSAHGSQVVTAAGSNAVQYTITNTGDGNNSFYIKNAYTGYNLDATSGGTANNTQIISWDQNNQINQKWQFFSNDSSYEIRGLASGRDIAIANQSTNPGTGILLYDHNTGWNQIWKIVPFSFSFTTQPSNSTAQIGTSSASFTAVANGSASSYQWQYSSDAGTSWNNTAATNSGDANGSWAGGTSATITLTATTTVWNGYQWRMAAVSSLDNKTYYSNIATLTVLPNPLVCTKQPANTTVAAGQTVNFTVGFTATSTGAAVNADSWSFSADVGKTYFIFKSTETIKINGAILSISSDGNTLTVQTTNPNNWSGKKFLIHASVNYLSNYSESNTVTLAFTGSSTSKTAVAAIALGAIPLAAATAEPSIYPNPSQGSSSVTVKNLTGISTISVKSVLGATMNAPIKTGNDHQMLNVANYAAGTYYIMVTNVVNGKPITKTLTYVK